MGDAGTSGAGAVPLRSAQMMGKQKKKKEVGTPPVRSNLCTLRIAVSTAVGKKVTETEKQLLKPEAKMS